MVLVIGEAKRSPVKSPRKNAHPRVKVFGEFRELGSAAAEKPKAVRRFLFGFRANQEIQACRGAREESRGKVTAQVSRSSRLRDRHKESVASRLWRAPLHARLRRTNQATPVARFEGRPSISG